MRFPSSSFHRFGLLMLSTILSIAVHAQPSVQVVGRPQQRNLTKGIYLCLEQLDVGESIHVTVVFASAMTGNLRGATIRGTSVDDVFRILVDAHLSNYDQLLVLAHELTHIRQYVKRDLVVQGDSARWKGRSFVIPATYDIHVPWERESYRLDQKLVPLFRKASRMLMAEASAANMRECYGTINLRGEPMLP